MQKDDVTARHSLSFGQGLDFPPEVLQCVVESCGISELQALAQANGLPVEGASETALHAGLKRKMDDFEELDDDVKKYVFVGKSFEHMVARASPSGRYVAHVYVSRSPLSQIRV
jgi:hypothetical protein